MTERESVSLNGVWARGDVVPTYTGIVVPEKKRYEHSVTVPENWQGKRVFLRFEKVNFTSDIYINGRFVRRHIGAWVPFETDITAYVAPGEEFTLEVDVFGRNVAPYANEETGLSLWPFGSEYEPEHYNVHHGYAGIVDDVTLLARGQVAIRDTFVKTSVAEGRMDVEYTLDNATNKDARVTLRAAVRGEQSAASADVLIPAGATVKQTVSLPRENLSLWWPDAPALYFLDSCLEESGAALDAESVRFGFREITVRGNRIYLNGVRFNIVSDYCLFVREKHWGYTVWNESGARETYLRLKDIGVNMVRWHKMPAPRYLLDMADELGMCIEAESAVGTLGAGGKYDYETLMVNYKPWAEEWVVGCRNHPSIIVWSAANEPVAPEAFCTTLGSSFYRTLDPTRPVVFEFAMIEHVPPKPDIDIYVYHYPRPVPSDPRLAENPAVWNGEPWNMEAGLYDAWNEFQRDDMPISMGEGLHSNCGGTGNYTQKRNEWWQGVWTRGMRYRDWAIIGPATFRWVRYVYEQNPQKVKNLRCAYARVALFDKAYDALGVAPYITGLAEGGTLPELTAGTREQRTLVLYNDEFHDTDVQYEVEVSVDGVVYASGRGEKQVPLGEHVEFDYAFDVPALPGRTMALTLRTWKGERQTFEESKRFRITGESAPVAPGTVQFL